MPITADDLEKYLPTDEDITEEQHEASKKQAETGRLPSRTAQLYTPDITKPAEPQPVRTVSGPEPDPNANPLEAEYQDLIQRERTQEFKDRGFLRGVASDVGGGLVDYGKLGLRAVRAVSTEGSTLEKAATSGIEGIERYKEQTPFLQEDPDGGFFSRAFHGGVRSATQSVAAGLPSAAAGAAAGSLIAGPIGTAVGGVLGYALGGASQFGLAQYDDVMERGLKAGLKREDVEPSAIRQGIYEGGFEFASDLLEGMTMGAGKLLTAPGKQAVKSTIKDMMKTSFKDLAKRTAGVTAIETGSEMITAGAQAEEDAALGLGDQRFWGAAVDAFGPSVVASMIFAGLGHANTKYAQRKIRKGLEDPKADLNLRAQAADEVYAALQAYNPNVADVWGQTVYQAIKEGKVISTDDNIMEMQEKQKPSQGFKLLPPPQAYPAQPYSREFAQELSELEGTPALPLPERRHWVGPTGEEFVLAGPTEPYNPEVAGEIHRVRTTPRLPPGQDFVLAGETDWYSPDFAERVQEERAVRRLPPGQEFELRGLPEDVDSTYSPEFAEELRPGPRRLPPQEKGFTMEGETPEQKVSRLDTRIRNLGTTLSQYVGQLDKATTPERKKRLGERIRTLQGQIDANREQRASLVTQLPGESPVEERAPQKSARESAEVFAREAGQVQSSVGRERLREKLKELESEKPEVRDEPKPSGAVQRPQVEQEAVKGPKISSDLEDALKSATQSITKINKDIDSKPSVMTVKEVAEEKAHVKGVLTREIKAGNIPVGHAVRSTELDELRHIMKTGKLLEGKSFEGTPGISATKITDRNNPAIPMYGSYDRIPVAIVAPPDTHIGKGQSANEVLLDPKADVRKLKFSIDMHDEVYGFDQLPEVLKEILGEKGETTLKPAETRAESGKPYSGKDPETETREKALGEKGEIARHKPGDMVVYKWNREERFGTIVDVNPDGRFKVAPRDRRGPADMDLVLSEKSLSPYVEPKFQNGDEVEWKDDSGKVRKGKVLSYWPGEKYKIEEPTPGGRAFPYKTESELTLARQEQKPAKEGTPAGGASHTKNKSQSGEGDSDKLSQGLLRVLGAEGQYKEEWTEAKKRGLTDQELKEAISEVFGIHGGFSAEGLSASFKGGKEPKYWHGSVVVKGPATLQGKALLKRVRELLEIPDRKEAKRETTKGPEPEPSFSLKQSTSDLRRVVLTSFPGARVLEETDSTIKFRMPNGSEILVNHATATLENGAEGAWANVGMDGIMWLAKDLDQEVVHHEAFEAAFDLALNERERKALIEKYGSAHEAAAAYQKWNPEDRPDTLFQKILDFFRRIRQVLFPTVELTLEDVRTGKAWDRITKGAGLERLGGVDLSEVDPQLLNLFGLIREGRKFYSDWEKQRLSGTDAKRKINQSFIDQAKELGYSEEQARAILDGFREVNDILNGLDDGLFEESNLDNPIRANADYIKTVDLNTTCPKRFKYASTIDVIQQRLGRPLTQGETTRIAKMLKDRGEEFPCLYCYVESGRGAYNSALIKYVREKDKTLNPRVFVDPLFEAEELKKEGMPERIRKARGYAQAASMSNQPKVYAEYRGQLLTMKKALRDEINKRAGLRFFSNTDFQAAHVLDLMQIVADMKMTEMMGHAYTKIPDFVRIFGKTGIKINMSVYGSVKDGKFIPDDKQGMPWEEATKLRREYPNAGTILVVTDPETLEWALDSPDIDMIIPWHRSGMGKETTEKGWIDFTRYQQESWIDPDSAPVDKDGKRVSAPHVYERYSGLDHDGPGHENSKEKYLAIAAKLGVNPKFPNHINHPGYMKLIRDYARVETPQAVVDSAGVDLVKAKDLIAAWAERGGEEKTPVQSVVDDFLARSKKAKPVFSLRGRQREARALQPNLNLDITPASGGEVADRGPLETVRGQTVPETGGAPDPLLPEEGETLAPRPKRSRDVPHAVASGKITTKRDFQDVLKYHTREEELLKQPRMWIHQDDPGGPSYLIVIVNIGNRTSVPHGYLISGDVEAISALADQSTERNAKYTDYGPLDGFSHYSLGKEGGQKVALSVFGDEHFKKVSSHVQKILSRWTGGPEVMTARSFSDLPAETRRAILTQQLRAQGKKLDASRAFAQYVADAALKLSSTVEGFILEGKVYLVAENLPTLKRAEEVLLHEVVGHYGIEAILGDRFKPFLDEVIALYGKQGLREISDLYGFDLNTSEGRRKAAREKIARMAETGEKPGFLKRLYGAIRETLRKMGFTLKLSDADIQRLLERARRSLEAGKYGKPGAAGTQTTSFSENDPDVLFSLSARDLLDKFQSRLQGTPKEAINISFGRNTDLRELRDSFRIPAWLAKTNRTVKRLFDRQNQRDKDRSNLYHDYLQRTTSVFDLKGPDAEEFSRLVFRLENKQVVKDPKFKKTGSRELAKGPEGIIVKIPVYELNEAHYRKLDEHLRKKGVSDTVRKAYMDARRALDTSLVQIYERLAEIRDLDPNLIEEYRNSMGSIHNYFPHNRYGNYHLVAIDPKAKPGEETKYRTHFKAVSERHAAWWEAKNRDRIVAELKKEHPETDWNSLEWRLGRNRDLPEEVYDFPIAVDAMQAIIDSATERIPEESGIKEKLRKELSEEISNVLKSRGFGSHMIKRKDIPGFERNDAARVLHDHLAGFSGWLTKMEAAHDFGVMLREIDARNHPNEYKWAIHFVQDMLQNQSQLDKFIDNARSFFFLKYLGLNLKTAALNLTQNFIAGVPRLAMDTGITTASRYFGKALKDIRLAVTEKAIKGVGFERLSADENKFLGEMFSEGWGQSQFVNEVRGKVGSGGAKALGKAIRIMGYPMELAERYNRLSLGLAAFRSARDGKMRTAREKASYEVAKDLAERIVNDSHFVYGKSNRPQVLRETAAGKLVSSAYTFRSFSHNLLSLWRWMLMTGDREGKKAFAYSLLAMVSLGGLTAIPLYNTLASLMRELFGEDLLGMGVRKSLPAGMRDLVMYGSPSIAGVNIGGSIGMELPVFDRMNINKSISGQMDEGIGQIIGVPYAVFDELAKAVDASKAGRSDRAVEMMAPGFLKNIMSAVRLSTQGQTTLSGTPINAPDERDPRKLTGPEAIAKGLGFQPVSSTKAFEMYKTLEELKSYRDSKQTELANRYVAAYREGDANEMVAVTNEARQWNRAAVLRGKPEMRVDLERALKSRQRAHQSPKQMRGLAKDLKESYGM